MISFLIETMINSLAQNDADYICRRIASSKVSKSSRIYFLSKGLAILFDNDHKTCVVKYKTDVVPLFVFRDSYSVSKIKNMLLEAK